MAYPPTRVPPLRQDAHNVSVDPVLAAAGRCGMTHLPTGRVCTRPARHPDSCEFHRRETAHGPVHAIRRQFVAVDLN
jgi:hypothetical protein